MKRNRKRMRGLSLAMLALLAASGCQSPGTRWPLLSWGSSESTPKPSLPRHYTPPQYAAAASGQAASPGPHAPATPPPNAGNAHLASYSQPAAQDSGTSIMGFPSFSAPSEKPPFRPFCGSG